MRDIIEDNLPLIMTITFILTMLIIAVIITVIETGHENKMADKGLINYQGYIPIEVFNQLPIEKE